MSEPSQQLETLIRDWQVPCYDSVGQMAVCVIDSDHGAVRVSFPGERENFFELRAEYVMMFQAGLKITLTALGKIKAEEANKAVLWEGHCYNKWGELRRCQIESIKHDAVRISCDWVGEPRCCFELCGDQIGVFQAALAEAIDLCHADVAVYGQDWADEETNEIETAPHQSMEEPVFTQEIYKMVAEDAPEMLAVVEEIGDRVDAVIIGWCFDFPHNAEVLSAGPDHVRGSFRSVESSLKLLSAGGKIKLRMVSVTEAQKLTKAA